STSGRPFREGRSRISAGRTPSKTAGDRVSSPPAATWRFPEPRIAHRAHHETIAHPSCDPVVQLPVRRSGGTETTEHPLDRRREHQTRSRLLRRKARPHTEY